LKPESGRGEACDNDDEADEDKKELSEHDMSIGVPSVDYN
jgi:hypothetical protein